MADMELILVVEIFDVAQELYIVNSATVNDSSHAMAEADEIYNPFSSLFYEKRYSYKEKTIFRK
jgi:hypothetical protein